MKSGQDGRRVSGEDTRRRGAGMLGVFGGRYVVPVGTFPAPVGKATSICQAATVVVSAGTERTPRKTVATMAMRRRDTVIGRITLSCCCKRSCSDRLLLHRTRLSKTRALMTRKPGHSAKNEENKP